VIAWSADASAQELARADERLLSARALAPEGEGTRTTPRDMVRLLRLI
jgi:hypothetical protein